MPWKECSAMSLRQELVKLAQAEGPNVAELCRRFGVSRKTAYKWIKVSKEQGSDALSDRSRRPHHSPKRSSSGSRPRFLAVREKHPVWGGRKIRGVLVRQGVEPPCDIGIHHGDCGREALRE
jgi:transposase